MPDKKPKIALKDSYLAMIKNAVGSNMFRGFYLVTSGRKSEITNDGRLSCAFFVSTILHFFGLVKDPHLTVAGLEKDLEKSGWKKIARPKIGAVLVWEKAYNNKTWNDHIGFYAGNDRAISNSSQNKKPTTHHWTYKGKRKIEAIYWNEKLSS